MQIHTINGHIQQTYLVEYDDSFLLLDGACIVDVPLIMAYIKALGKKPSDLKLMIVTHTHPDHAGGAVEIKKRTGCKIAMTNIAKPWYGGKTSFANYFIDVMLAHWVAKRTKAPNKKLWYNPFITPDYKLNNNSPLPIFDDWQVYWTPGHTDRDMTFYHKEHDVAYIGDLVLKTNRGDISPFPIYYPEKYQNSLAVVKQLQPKQLLLAHGGIQDYADVNFDEAGSTAPSRPLYTWVVLKIKAKQVLKMPFAKKVN